MILTSLTGSVTTKNKTLQSVVLVLVVMPYLTYAVLMAPSAKGLSMLSVCSEYEQFT